MVKLVVLSGVVRRISFRVVWRRPRQFFPLLRLQSGRDEVYHNVMGNEMRTGLRVGGRDKARTGSRHIFYSACDVRPRSLQLYCVALAC